MADSVDDLDVRLRNMDLTIERWKVEDRLRWAQSAPSLVADAVAPLGLQLEPLMPGDLGTFNLTLGAKDVGTVMCMDVTQRVYIGLHETERIQLGRLRWHEFPATSSAELYDQLTAWLSSIVTKTKVPVRRAVRGSKHRDLLCVSADNGHAVKFARHVFVSSDQKRETWRCDECGHETTIPAASFPKEPGTEAT